MNHKKEAEKILTDAQLTKSDFINDAVYETVVNNIAHVLLKNTDELEKCTSCDGYFAPENIVTSADETFCTNCNEGILSEIRSVGIKHIDEYLTSRNLQKDFHVFSHAKWSGVTEEEFKELNPE
jgi:hypothetical protein